MSSKVNTTMPSVNSPEEVRNVVLVGSAGSGKTTLFEQILKGHIPGYRGEKEDPERAAALTLASIGTGDVVINLMDAPGHPDFVGELRAGLRAADAAVFVVSAADGIDGTTTLLWQECKAVGLPRAIVVTKLDTGHATFEQAVEACQQAFGDGVMPTHLPLTDDQGAAYGNISLLSQKLHDYSSGERVETDTDEGHREQIETARNALIEGIIQESEDDTLMDRYLEGDELALDDIIADLLTAVAHANFYPVIPVQSHTGVGTEELIYLIQRGFPTPSLHPLPAITAPDGGELPAITCDPDGPLVAEVVRTTSDPFAGRLSMVRIFSGTLKQDDPVHVSGHRARFTGHDDAAHPDHDDDERVGPITAPVGLELKPKAQAIAGEIVMVAKLAHAETSDTLSSRERPALVEPWVLPEPLLPVAIHAATRNDEDKLASALQRLAVEDTTVRLERTAETDQLVLWTMGQAHVDLLLNRLTDRYGVKVEGEEVKVALRETFVKKTTQMGRHVKQSGGHGQYAVCQIEIEPLERGAGFEFVDKVVGGAVPRQFIPSVEKGVRSQLEKGALAGYPLVDVRVTLFDGKAHSVDSSDMAFQTAGALAIKEAATPQTVALLEPIDEVTITVGEEYMGAIMTDVSGRRGQLLGTDSDEDRHAIIRALIPASELSRYAIDLRGLAHGSGSFTREFHGYETLPANLADAYIKAAQEK